MGLCEKVQQIRNNKKGANKFFQHFNVCPGWHKAVLNLRKQQQIPENIGVFTVVKAVSFQKVIIKWMIAIHFLERLIRFTKIHINLKLNF